MIKIDKQTKKDLIEISEKNKIFIEGNLLKLIDPENDADFNEYLKKAIENDRESRRKRLEVTKQIQTQNKELIKTQDENEKLLSELKIALEEAEKAKQIAIDDLDVLQKKSQFELIKDIVKVALYVIVGVGITSSVMYMLALYLNKDTQIISSAWTNMLSILLTNAFSIVGTIMGIKYASDNKDKK